MGLFSKDNIIKERPLFRKKSPRVSTFRIVALATGLLTAAALYTTDSSDENAGNQLQSQKTESCTLIFNGKGRAPSHVRLTLNTGLEGNQLPLPKTLPLNGSHDDVIRSVNLGDFNAHIQNVSVDIGTQTCNITYNDGRSASLPALIN